MAEEAERKRQMEDIAKREETELAELVTGCASLVKVRKRSPQRWPSDPELGILGEEQCCFIKCNMEVRRGR